jgi:hypothetical protein
MPASRRERTTACAICRQPTAAGDRLCAPCNAALKRARDSTISEAILPARRGRRRPAADAPAPEVAPVVAALPRSRWIARGAWAACALTLFVAGGAWLAHTRGIAGTIAPRYAIDGPDTSAATIQAASTTVAPAPSAAAPVEKSVAPVTAVVDEEPARPDPRTLPSTITMPRGNGTMADTPSAPAPAPPVTPPSPVVDTPLPPPVAVAPPAPRPAPDRWQRLADQIARCASEDLFARTMCEESLRLEHCQGQWGRVAACPPRAERDYGN